MKYCTKCGAELAADSKFCVSCGTPVNNDKVEMAGEVNPVAPVSSVSTENTPVAPIVTPVSSVSNTPIENVSTSSVNVTPVVNSSVTPVNNVAPANLNTNIENTSINLNVKKRNVVLMALLPFITLGISNLVWLFMLVSDYNKVSDKKSLPAIVVILLSIITLGIYELVWFNQIGQNLHQAAVKYNKDVGDFSILFMIMSFFKLDYVNYIVLQVELNKFAN